jgi:hypothetical protein
MKAFSNVANQRHFVPTPWFVPMAPVPTRFLFRPKSLLALEIGDEGLLKCCQPVPFCAIPAQ